MNRALQLRLDRRQSMTDAAREAGIHPKTLRKLEDGNQIGAAPLGKVADLYGVRPSALLMPAITPTEEAAA